ncbi:MAG: hypothetical protein ACKV19_29550 [Verrucomicrobiales bacterium]
MTCWPANAQPAPPASDSPFGVHRDILERLSAELELFGRRE